MCLKTMMGDESASFERFLLVPSDLLRFSIGNEQDPQNRSTFRLIYHVILKAMSKKRVFDLCDTKESKQTSS